MSSAAIPASPAPAPSAPGAAPCAPGGQHAARTTLPALAGRDRGTTAVGALGSPWPYLSRTSRSAAGSGIATGRGVTEIEFTRKAPSWAEAIGSAVRDVESVPGLVVTGAGQDDLVSMSDIAHRAKRTREAVRLWAAGRRGPGGFPGPVWEAPSGEKFWSWQEVGRWVRDNLNLAVNVTPDEVRWADEVLKARQSLAEAHKILAENDAMRQQFGPLLTRQLGPSQEKVIC